MYLIQFPFLALIPFAVFVWFAYSLKNRACKMAASLWLAYGILETLNLYRITCSGECNIRVDLLLIYPVLMVISLAAAWSVWTKRIDGKPKC